ncbi:PadR family transcriptional regulator [Companilactobacillus sp.]|jgi:PadR family transcriptional regulator PadR|uniref:PadR family transcriptional regulator n=1 Tax=Companilactobacillus sp. TaxID=2767905 RepID=UPI0025BE87B9|nr:PadR family transcriptional regulator [Companilactobacillus sp.]MCH4007928.1 PadR family transcriptional regulator [Companilactobacillus sp.]MCH4051893.1 PadR family transcriptional regulator [Companilactobacillus sp.]MCH4075871.1 PadR family transcriptional regulator [Companilactobacillus sp.]MCH4124446.1 PadR family transcriptional regulator [Companilactobacillus sp.]MCH4132591.1 PadR family transcriptional regulator [Companilactobacillus sp.]
MKGLTELLKGSLEGIVLQHISKGETYGYEITNYLIDFGFEDIVEGTVYTVLLRLEKKNLLTVERRKSDVGPQRKFYRLNENGEKYLKEFWTKWTFLAEKMQQLEDK